MRIEVSKEQVLKAFSEVANNPVFAESAQLMTQGTMPLEMIRTLCANPKVLNGFAALSDTIYPGGMIDREVQEVVILTVSAENSCQFCSVSHCDIAKNVGVSRDPAKLVDSPSQMTEQQRLAAEWSLAVTRDSNNICDELFQKVHACFGDAAVVELTILVGYINMLNLFNNALRNAYNGELEQNPEG